MRTSAKTAKEYLAEYMTEEQEKSGPPKPVKLDEIRDYNDAHGVVATELYHDKKFSSKKMTPELELLLDSLLEIKAKELYLQSLKTRSESRISDLEEELEELRNDWENDEPRYEAIKTEILLRQADYASLPDRLTAPYRVFTEDKRRIEALEKALKTLRNPQKKITETEGELPKLRDAFSKRLVNYIVAEYARTGVEIRANGTEVNVTPTKKSIPFFKRTVSDESKEWITYFVNLRGGHPPPAFPSEPAGKGLKKIINGAIALIPESDRSLVSPCFHRAAVQTKNESLRNNAPSEDSEEEMSMKRPGNK